PLKKKSRCFGGGGFPLSFPFAGGARTFPRADVRGWFSESKPRCRSINACTNATGCRMILPTKVLRHRLRPPEKRDLFALRKKLRFSALRARRICAVASQSNLYGQCTGGTAAK